MIHTLRKRLSLLMITVITAVLQRLSERYFDFFNLNLSNAGSETYKEEPRYKEYAIGKAAEQLKVITSCNIGALLSETRDKGK